MAHFVLQFRCCIEVLHLGCGLENAQDLDANLLAQVALGGRAY